MPYHYSLVLQEEAYRLDQSVRYDRIDHAISYIKSMRELLAALENQYIGETK